MISALADFISGIVLGIVAIPAGLLPRRHWQSLDQHVPVFRMAFMSGIASIVVAAAIGLPAYLRYAQSRGDMAAAAMLEAAGWPTTHPTGRIPVPAAQAVWTSAFILPLTFVLTTPLGLLSTYLFFTGLFRSIGAYVDDAHGDPLLTMIDGAASRIFRRARERRRRLAREALEGPEVPDCVLSGEAAEMPEAEIVIVASRKKDGWTPGTVVITAEKWYTLGTPVDRDTPSGLRTLYPLTPHGELEVVRRAVEYDLRL